MKTAIASWLLSILFAFTALAADVQEASLPTAGGMNNSDFFRVLTNGHSAKATPTMVGNLLGTGSFVTTNDSRTFTLSGASIGGNASTATTATNLAGPSANVSGTNFLLMADQVHFKGSMAVGNGGQLLNTNAPNPTDPLPNMQDGENNSLGNTFVGINAGLMNDSGVWNTFVGNRAGEQSTNSTQNVCVGYVAGSQITSGYHNTYLGAFSGSDNDTGTYNVCIGTDSSQHGHGSFQTIIGAGSGGVENGSENTFLGSSVGPVTTNGSWNLFCGSQSGTSNTVGSQNVFLGYKAGKSNTTGSNNVCIGANSGDVTYGTNTQSIGLCGPITKNQQVVIGNGQNSYLEGVFNISKISINPAAGVSPAALGLTIGQGSVLVGTSYANSNSANDGSVLLSGRLGVGTTIPDRPGMIAGTSNTDPLLIQTPNPGGGVAAFGGYGGIAINCGNTTVQSSIRSYANASQANGADLAFWVSGSSGTMAEGMRLAHGGKLGLGTTNPVTLVDARGDITGSNIIASASLTVSNVFDLYPLASTTTNANALRFWNSNNAAVYVRGTNGIDKLVVTWP